MCSSFIFVKNNGFVDVCDDVTTTEALRRVNGMML